MQTDIDPGPEIAYQPILVVDDHEIKRYAMRKMLEHAGYTVQEAVTGEEALSFLEQATLRPWLVLLDIRLPGIDGLEVCRRIKASPIFIAPLVLHMSAHYTGSEDRISGMNAGADGYVTVPLDARVLVAQIRSLQRLAQAEWEYRNAALAAQEGETKLHTILESLQEGVLQRDASGMIQVANASAKRILGVDSESLHDLTMFEESGVVTAEDGSPLPLESHPSMVALREGRPVIGAVIGIRRPNDEQAWISVNAQPLSDSYGRSTGVVTSFFDITERRRMEQELAETAAKQEHIAETLQRSLLLTHQSASFPGIDVHVEYEAAWSDAMLGGDFADAFALDDDHVAFVVGDVTGKGLIAATYTAEIKFSLRAYLRESPDPVLAMNRLNRYLIDGQRLDSDPHEEYVSLAIAVLNRHTREIRFCAAGAEPPLIVRHAEEGEAVWTEAIDISGPLLAIDVDSDYSAATTHLRNGDLLVLTTDGITEARYGQRGSDFFGYERYAATAERVTHLPSLQVMARSIVNAALEFAGGHQRDDICVLVAR